MTGKKKNPSEELEDKPPIVIDGDSKSVALGLLQYITQEDWWWVKKQQKWFHMDGRLETNEQLIETFLKAVTNV